MQVLDSCVAIYRLQMQSLGSYFSLTIWLFYVQTTFTIKCMLVCLSCHKCNDPQQKRLMAFMS